MRWTGTEIRYWSAGEVGVIVRAANDALGFHLEFTRYWEIMWADGLQVVLNDDLEVISEGG